MKNIITLLFVLLGSMSIVNAQERKAHNCGSDELHLKQLDESPSYKSIFDKTNKQWQDFNLLKMGGGYR